MLRLRLRLRLRLQLQQLRLLLSRLHNGRTLLFIVLLMLPVLRLTHLVVDLPVELVPVEQLLLLPVNRDGTAGKSGVGRVVEALIQCGMMTRFNTSRCNSLLVACREDAPVPGPSWCDGDIGRRFVRSPSCARGNCNAYIGRWATGSAVRGSTAMDKAREVPLYSKGKQRKRCQFMGLSNGC